MPTPDNITQQPSPDSDWRLRPWLIGIPEGDRRVYFALWLKLYVNGSRTAATPPRAERHRADAAIAKRARDCVRELRRSGVPADARMAAKLESFIADRKAKRPKRDDDEFAKFVGDIMLVASALGGRVSFNRTTGGNMAALLDKLRPALPRLIPDWKHPPAKIERLATKARKRLKDAASPWNAIDTVSRWRR